MNRRTATASVLSIFLAGCIDEVERTISSVGSDEASSDESEFGFGGPGFESIEWVNFNELRVNFEPDHQMNFFTINHEYRADFNDALYSAEAPEFGGNVVWPMIDKIKNFSTVYPTRNFELHGYKGAYGLYTMIDEDLGSVGFKVPKTIAPPEKFDDI